jgi:hypothetical protein
MTIYKLHRRPISLGVVPSGRCEEIGKCTHTVIVTYAVDLYSGIMSTLPDPPLPRLASIDRSQLLLHTVDVERLIDEDHSARSIWHLVGRMNLSLYHAKIVALEGRAGRDHTAPQLLISLWLYGYSQGTSSAREIARQCAPSTPTGDRLHVADEFIDIVQKGVATLALLVAGYWAFFRFIRFRTLKPRVEFRFEWSGPLACEAGRVGILALKMSNKGNTKIELRKDGTNLCMLKYALLKAKPGTEPMAVISRPAKELKHLGQVFAAHKSIEPGDTIDDVRTVLIRDLNCLAAQFEIRVYGANKWTASAAFPLARLAPRASSTSEDEEDKYSQCEKLRDLLGSRKFEAEDIVSDGRAGEDEKALLDTIERAMKVTSKLSADAKDDVLKEAKKLLDELDELLRSHL